MHVKRIELRRFMSHEGFTVELPDQGIVVVTGPNGSGKSAAMIESVAAALWGKTVRGSQPWRQTGESSAEVHTRTFHVKRTRKGQKATLSFAHHGQEPASYGTQTEAQKTLDALIPDFDVWRRTAVFSSSDASHFSLASDGERKRLLELVLGLERFDQALAACRAEVKANQVSLAQLGNQVYRAKADMEAAEQRMAELREEAEPEPECPTGAELEQLQKRQQETHRTLQLLAKQIVDGARAEAKLRAKCEAAMERAARLDVGECPECGQAVPEELRTRLRAEQIVADKEHVEAQDAQRQFEANAQERSRALEAARQIAERELARGRAQQERWQQWHRAKERRVERYDEARHKLLQAAERLDGLECRQDQERALEAELAAAEAVLGLRGVRGHVLRQATGAVESLANAWLARMFPGVEVALGEEGGDKLTLGVTGLAHGHGYKGSSGGERRRIDVALLLALAEVAAGAAGQGEAGTLLVDEVFDALDEDGIEAVSEVLTELSRERAVVVITHSSALANRLTATARVQLGL